MNAKDLATKVVKHNTSEKLVLAWRDRKLAELVAKAAKGSRDTSVVADHVTDLMDNALTALFEASASVLAEEGGMDELFAAALDEQEAAT